MTGISKLRRDQEDVPESHKPCSGPPRAMLVPMRKLPKQSQVDQEFAVPAELANCIMVSEAQCCVGRRPSGTAITCVVPEGWIAMSSCHGIIYWKGVAP